MSETLMLTPRELVLQKFPGAFVEDDGSWVYIIKGETVTEQCPHCGQKWTHKDGSATIFNTLAGGNCAESAWESAAKKLRLI